MQITDQTTEQEVFDFVCRHLANQGKRAASGPMGDCMYRTPDGLKCAVGCLIPDEEYDPGMENWLVRRLLRSYPELDRLARFEGLLIEMQGIHDGHALPIWPAALQNLARSHNLTFPDLDWSKCARSIS